MEITNADEYNSLIIRISETYRQGQNNAVLAVNTHLVETYWQIGRHIVEFEQGGSERAKYGKNLLAQLSRDLSISHGKGFSLSNLIRMRQFYTAYPIYAELPHKLSWTHWVEILKIDDPLERSFYIQQTQIDGWSTTELIRQKKSSLFLRLAASRDKEGILKLAKEGQFEKEENTEGDNPPVGIVLAKEKDELLIKYATHNISSQLFVSKYQIYLPDREELKALILRELNRETE